METGKQIGVVGCGNRMKEVLKYLFKLNSNHKIIAITDPCLDSIKDYLDEFGNEIKVYSDYQSLIAESGVDWIFIGSINNAHKDQIDFAFKNKKNIFSEKPLAISIKECKEIKEFYEKYKTAFFISYPLRYSEHYKKIKEILDSGIIGNIVSMEFNEVLSFRHGSFIMTDWRRLNKNSGGHLLEKCCHDIDIANYLVSSLPVRVASFGGLNLFRPENTKIFKEVKSRELELTFNDKVLTDPFLSDKDIIDNQVAIIEYNNNVHATFHTNCSSGIPERRMYICGTKGTIRSDLLKGEIEYCLFGSSSKITKILGPNDDTGHGGGDEYLAIELDNSLINNTSPFASINVAIISTIICLKIEEAMNSGKVVLLNDIWKEFGLIENLV